MRVSEVYCSPYCTFIVNGIIQYYIVDLDEVYGCGLNNRGQLGIGSLQSIGKPKKITALSKKNTTQTHISLTHRKDSKPTLRQNRINSIALA